MFLSRYFLRGLHYTFQPLLGSLVSPGHLLLPQLPGEKEPQHQGWSCRMAGGVTETNLSHMPFQSLLPKTLPLHCKITPEKLLLHLPARQPSSTLNVSPAPAVITHLICNSFCYKVALWPAKAFFLGGGGGTRKICFCL